MANKGDLLLEMKDVKKRFGGAIALSDARITIRAGEIHAFLGENGAGKSTLMRAIAGILPPTEGRITVDGNISTLLALGIGFNQALSGRDNIILGGLAAGLTKDQITGKVDEIAEFADLPTGFLDLPVRTYSAGMYSRIAFSVSVAMTPDILLIDDILDSGLTLSTIVSEIKAEGVRSGKPITGATKIQEAVAEKLSSKLPEGQQEQFKNIIKGKY